MQKTKSLFFVLLILCLMSTAHSLADNYWQTYGPAKIIPYSDTFPDINDLEKLPQLSPQDKLTVLVTPDDPYTFQAIKELLQQHPYFRDLQTELQGIKTLSNIAPQPLGLENAERGAFNRLQTIQQQPQIAQHADLIFAVEHFFTKPNVHQPREHALILMMTQLGNTLRFISDGVEVYPEFYDLALDKKGLTRDGTGAYVTIGEILADIYGVDQYNWHYFVTQHKMNKTQQILSAFEVQE